MHLEKWHPVTSSNSKRLILLARIRRCDCSNMLQNAVEDVLDVLGDLDHDCLVTRSVCTSMISVSLPLTVTSVNSVIIVYNSLTVDL